MTDFEILEKRRLAPNVCEYKIYAPLVAKHCLAGQFVILRTDGEGERVPFTICDYSRKDGTVTILVQEVGYTTLKLSHMQMGERLADLVGPLGNPTDLSKYRKICLVGGGIGVAVIYPQAKQLFSQNKSVDVISGARNESLLLYSDKLQKYCDDLYCVTDDGSNGRKGFVTDVLVQLIAEGKNYDCVFAVGPLGMMKAVCDITKAMNVPTVVSMNSMMVDGTGMCGCCRLSVGGETKYACIDGPEFDGHLVDFDEAIMRGRTYLVQEREHYCNLRRAYGKD